ncbi:hypothetical protein SDC9_137123 [bioreactor metagenome]|uniref:HTH crp-type domain-containing protein n=1 Tax=bioreactor metagenome TaxID=1076179 RepID=A0A645DL56_9ZZZZ|nr:Crp/Fnr family transcriptional regulator [Erysipelotrichaceae bacterium]
MIDKDLSYYLKNSILVWNKLSIDEQGELVQSSALNCYQKGENLHGRESGCIGTMFVITGQLRVYILSDEGKEITLYRLYANDSCVLSASCVLANINFDVIIDAEVNSEVLMINSAVVSQVMKRNIYFECYIYKLTTERFSDVMWAMQQILFRSIDERLAACLWDASLHNADSVITVTHETLAKDIGSAREVVSRMLKYFENEGIVKLSRKGITITDKRKLRMLIK